MRIGLFTSELAYKHIRPILPLFKDRCDIDPVIVDHLDSLSELFRRNQKHYDAFLFGSWLMFAYISSTCHLDKPYAYFSSNESDYYRTLVQAVSEHPEVPFSQYICDSFSSFHGYFDVMDSKNHCLTMEPEKVMISLQKEDGYRTVDEKLDSLALRYIDIIEESQIKIVVSGLSPLKNKIEALGIPFYYIYPQRDSILASIEHLLNHLESGDFGSSVSVNGLIYTKKTPVEDVWNILTSFLWKNGLDCVITKEQNMLRLIVSNGDFHQLTNSQTDCLISRELLNHGMKDFCLGWGIGFYLSMTKKNSMRALNLAKKAGPATSIVVTATNETIGPLLDSTSHLASTEEESKALSYQYNLSRRHIQQIKELRQKTNETVFTGKSLAETLQIHERTARRILARLEEGGGAVLVYDASTKERGRPQLQYRLLIDF